MASVRPIAMEDHFAPGLKRRPAVHVGSQTMRLFRGDAKEQAWEGLHLGAAFDSDLVVLRDVDPHYLTYWQQLTGGSRVISLTGSNPQEFLSKVILDRPEVVRRISKEMDPGATLQVFFPTPLEQELADALGIPLHGTPAISGVYGTKSGIRSLAADCGIPMPPGCVCSTRDEVRDAIRLLGDTFPTVAIKHDCSTGGTGSTRWNPNQVEGLEAALDAVAGGRFIADRDAVVVEGWLPNATSLCAHLELVPGREPIVCAAWEQIIDQDGLSYVGAKPLALPASAMAALRHQLNALARALHERGAVGSYAPDFLIATEEGGDIASGSVMLLELNARVPATAFPLEIVKRVRGRIGEGFCARHVSLERPMVFADIAHQLDKEGLLIRERDGAAHGIVPYNVGLLPWGICDVVAMADSWEETEWIMERLNAMFGPANTVVRPQSACSTAEQGSHPPPKARFSNRVGRAPDPRGRHRSSPAAPVRSSNS